MTIVAMKKALISNHQSKLNKDSKWYHEDVADFKNNLNKVSDSRVKEMYRNMVAFNSPSFEKWVEQEEGKMLKAGLFDMKNLKPQNCLD